MAKETEEVIMARKEVAVDIVIMVIILMRILTAIPLLLLVV